MLEEPLINDYRIIERNIKNKTGPLFPVYYSI